MHQLLSSDGSAARALVIHILIAVAGSLLIVFSLPGTIELALLTFAGILPARKQLPLRGVQRLPIDKLAVVIPAHDEAENIAAAVTSVAGCEIQPLIVRFAIVVIADNCTDDTAKIALNAGARVIERTDETLRGKGYALQYGFDRLGGEGFNAFLIVDADTVVEPNLLIEIIGPLESGAGVQTRYGVLNPEASIRTRLMNTALMAVNVLRPRGRDRLGLSAGILGNGFALTSATLAAVPYDAHSVVEDLEYSLRIVRSGHRIAFADGTTVRGIMPAAGRGVETQRTRWEGGRLRMILQNVPRLAQEILTGKPALIEPLLDLLLLPLAFHVILLIAAAAIPFDAARI
ncbi:MAG TPA: glycosyltransferase family 2 protein, partial [Candidatus Binataceae bacterium]|nr:glycosyltransferase family 2 protein [Candidatus Binataceae bacterium]